MHNCSPLKRRINISACHVESEIEVRKRPTYQQIDLFTSHTDLEKQDQELEKEKRLQKATLEIKKKYGKNAVLKALDLEKGATAKA